MFDEEIGRNERRMPILVLENSKRATRDSERKSWNANTPNRASGKCAGNEEAIRLPSFESRERVI